MSRRVCGQYADSVALPYDAFSALQADKRRVSRATRRYPNAVVATTARLYRRVRLKRDREIGHAMADDNIDASLLGLRAVDDCNVNWLFHAAIPISGGSLSFAGKPTSMSLVSSSAKQINLVPSET